MADESVVSLSSAPVKLASVKLASVKLALS